MTAGLSEGEGKNVDLAKRNGKSGAGSSPKKKQCLDSKRPSSPDLIPPQFQLPQQQTTAAAAAVDVGRERYAEVGRAEGAAAAVL
jgi:hypothetical protein